MKKILNYILVTAILGTFLPYSALAETTNVGVNITGSTSIDVVTTISTNITLDLTTGETTPTYMEIKNNSLVPVNAKITDISTTSEGAPSTFVGQADKDWNSLSREETETYVNFNILGEGQNVKPKDILANTELDLGTLDSKVLAGKDCSLATELCYDSTESDTKIFEINANFGKNWSSGDKNFTYQITTVYSRSNDYIDPTLSYTYDFTDLELVQFGLLNIRETVDIENIDSTKNYITFIIEGTYSEDSGLDSLLGQFTIISNDEEAIYAGKNAMGTVGYSKIELHYAIDALEEHTNYLTIKIIVGNNTYTYIAKVVNEAI